MEIHAAGAAGKVRETVTTATSRKTLPEDQAVLSDATALQAALEQTPATRPEAVARARQLLADDSYPSHAVRDRTAEILARNLAA